jgi:NAD(P)-dependent dehydrogenase (short-subunit alcohol dehydrogenase family)
MGVCDGRVALVTGSSRGIGRAIARRLAAEGASVVLSASRLGTHGEMTGTLEEAVTQIQDMGGRASAVVGNLAEESDRCDLVQRASEAFGPLDILVNNAAMARWGMPSALSLDDRRKMLEVNLHAPMDLAQQVLPGMRERGRGWILNISSDTARQPTVPYPDTPEMAHVIAGYGASKAALNRFSEGLAHEVSQDGVYVNTLAPVAIVLTQEANRFVGPLAKRRPDMVEPIEVMVEAALELVSEKHVGQTACSRTLLHSLGRRVRSLDGTHELGDGLMPAGLDSVVT